MAGVAGAMYAGECPVCMELVSPSDARPISLCHCKKPCPNFFDQVEKAMALVWHTDERTWPESARVIKAGVDALGGWERDSPPPDISPANFYERLYSLRSPAVVMPCCHVSATPVCISCLQQSFFQTEDGIGVCPMCRNPYTASRGALRYLIEGVTGLLKNGIEKTGTRITTKTAVVLSGKIEKGLKTLFSVLALGNSGATHSDVIHFLWSFVNKNMDMVFDGCPLFVDVANELHTFSVLDEGAKSAPAELVDRVYNLLRVHLVRTAAPGEDGLRPGDLIVLSEEDVAMSPFAVEASLLGARPHLTVLDPQMRPVVVLPQCDWPEGKIRVVDETPGSPHEGHEFDYRLNQITPAGEITVRVRRACCGCGNCLGNVPEEVTVQPGGAQLWSVERAAVERAVDFLVKTQLLFQAPTSVLNASRSNTLEALVDSIGELIDMVYD